MSSEKNQEQLRGSFREKGPSAPVEPAPEAPEVSQAIAKKAPAPELKPKGSWRARAENVDQRVREQQSAKKAKSEWAKRLSESRKQGKGFNMSARGI